MTCGSDIKTKLMKRKKKSMMDGKGGPGKAIVNAAANVISAPSRALTAIKGRRKQNKMIVDYVKSKPSKLPPWERSAGAVEQEWMDKDKKIKNKLRGMGAY